MEEAPFCDAGDVIEATEISIRMGHATLVSTSFDAGLDPIALFWYMSLTGMAGFVIKRKTRNCYALRVACSN